MSIEQTTTQGFDTIVVGNGVLGLSLGLELARAGTRVAVVGPVDRLSGATPAAGAMNGVFGEVTASLTKGVHGRAKLEMGMRATSLWPEWIDGLTGDGDAPVKTANGTTVILNAIGTPQVDDVNFKAIRSELEYYQVPFDDVDPSDVEWLDPEPMSRPLAAFHIPGEHGVDSGVLVRRLQASLLDAGGVILDAHVATVEHTGDRVTGVSLQDGSPLWADSVVLASGAYTSELLRGLPVADLIPPLVAGYGVSAVIDTEDGLAPRSVIRTPNRSFACGLHAVPRGAGSVYVGATNVVSATPVDVPVVRDLVFLLQCAHRQLNRTLWSSPLTKPQVGNRPVALDGFPLIGEGGMDGLYLLTGTYRDGLHMSPLLAAEMAHLIRREPTSVELDIFRPVRAPIQDWTRQQVIDDVVDHAIATGFEQDWTVPVDWPLWIEADMRPAIAQWADELDPEFTPPPEILFGARFFPDLAEMLRTYYATARKQPVPV